MTYIGDAPSQSPATAAFLGAQRAEHYFEEAPTETVRRSSPPIAEGVIAQVPEHLNAQPEIRTEASGIGSAEAILRRVAEPPPVPHVAGAPASPGVPVGMSKPLVTTGAARAPRWGRKRHADAEREKNRATVRLSTWPRSVGILVGNPKGSVGKTPTALALGGVFASIRGGQTVVLEVTDDPGSLALRAEGPAWAGLGELVRDVSVIRGAGELSSYSAQQTSFAAVVGSPRDRAALNHVDVDSVTALLEYFYPVRVMDSGNQVSSSAFYGAAIAADVLVIPVLNAPDAVAGAEQMLRHLHRSGGHFSELARAAIAVRLDDGRRANTDTAQRVSDSLLAAGITEVIDIPFDPHIAERSTITLGHLRPATLDAFTRAAAAVSDRLTARLR